MIAQFKLFCFFLSWQILKYTPENHFDRSSLETALEKAEELCQQVNEGVRNQENTDRLEWLQSHVNLESIGEVCGRNLAPSFLVLLSLSSLIPVNNLGHFFPFLFFLAPLKICPNLSLEMLTKNMMSKIITRAVIWVSFPVHIPFCPTDKCVWQIFAIHVFVA